MNKKVIGSLSFLLLLMFVMALTALPAFATTYTDDLIPAMTGYNTPSGIVTASADIPLSWRAWYAFSDTLNDAGWQTSSTPGWLAYEFPTAQVISKYTITATTTNTLLLKYTPKDWTFEAYNETTGEWIILDTQRNMVDWASGEKRAYTFNNTTAYKKYRINISATSSTDTINIGEMEMMGTAVSLESITISPSSSSIEVNNSVNLTATATFSDSTTQDVTSSATWTSSDETVAIVDSNGVVTGVAAGTATITVTYQGQTASSSIIVTTPAPTTKALLVITMVNGFEKEYDLSMTEVNAFIEWYNNRANGTGNAYYTIDKSYNKGPFISRKDNIVFDKIMTFEVMEYNQ